MDDKRIVRLKIKTLREEFIATLSNTYGKEEATSLFYIVAQKYLNKKRVDIALNLEKEITENQWQLINAVQKRLQEHEPVQYILEETVFYGLTFVVNEHVLIPRQETEELVDWIIKDVRKRNEIKPLKILDIGTGSGCIAVALATNLPQATIYALDISNEALEVVKKNAVYNSVTIHTFQADILSLPTLKERFDIIVSNPPYVRELEKKEIKANVLDYEPHGALFVPNANPLVFYEKITDLAKQSLNPGGMLYFEINQYLGQDTLNMIRSREYSEVTLRKDINQNDRMIKVSV